jgi:ribonuclease T1
MASRRRSSPGGLLALVIVAALLVGVWLISGGFPDSSPDGSRDGSPAGSPNGSPTTGAGPTATASASPRVDPDSGLPLVALGDLPPEAAETVDLIVHGAGFPYDEDGGPFGNREGLLPEEGGDYYREYTVPTPGSPDRGARRIVEGAAGELYWTADHYDSFARIVP